ncbi:MAG: hypothetical protein Q4G09_00195 [Clostridia bacterium]|nr:hypothetical protein [Clostridia bacterium]
MKDINLLSKLEKYTNIPKLSFEYEAKEYMYMADVVSQVNYIFKNLKLIELNKKNLKIYKDDPETIKNIKETIIYYEETINNSLKSLDELYLEHFKHLERINNTIEEEEEL